VPVVQRKEKWAKMRDLFLPCHQTRLLKKGLDLYSNMTWQSQVIRPKVGIVAKNV
jgi:hypothetical protein